MSRPAVEVADVLHAQGEHFLEQHPWLSVQQRTVLRALARCRTAALGGHLDQCGACGHRAISYNSCRNRHCPKCQAQARERWLAARERELLDVPYVHVVFTLPHALLPLCHRNAALVYHAALPGERGHAARGRRRPAPSRRGDRLPEHPPHVGPDARPASPRALRRAGRRPVAGSPALGAPEVRRLLLTREGPQSRVSRQIRRGAAPRVRPRRTRSRGATASLRDPAQWHAFVDALFQTDWVVYAKPAFGGAAAVLRYLGRYTHRVAISNHRLIAFDGERVTFRWKDYAHDGQLAHDDAHRDGVSPALRPACAPTRLRPHSAVWLSRQSPVAPRASPWPGACSRNRHPRAPTTLARRRPRHVVLSTVRRADDHRCPPHGRSARHASVSGSTPHDRTHRSPGSGRCRRDVLATHPCRRRVRRDTAAHSADQIRRASRRSAAPAPRRTRPTPIRSGHSVVRGSWLVAP